MPTKKPTPKKSTVKTVKVEKIDKVKNPIKLDFSSKIVKVHLIPFIILLLIFGYLARTQLYVANVNGENISRLKLISLLEKQGGQQVLDGLITETLIRQEAENQNIIITQEEIDAELSSLEAQFANQKTSFDDLLNMQGITRDELKDQLKLQLLAEKMVSDKIEVTDEEINTYIEDNKDTFPEDTETESEEFINQIRESLKSQKTNQAINDLITSLKAKAEITYNIEY